MWRGLKAFWFGILHVNYRGYVYIWANVLWALLSIPLITAPAAWAGLMKMSHEAYHNPSTNIHVFWEGFKENFQRGLVLALLNFIIVGINIWNLIAYRQSSGVEVAALRVLWLSVLWVWFTIQLYMWAIFYEMETPTLWGAMRNAFVMLTLNLPFSVGLWIGIIPVLIVSTLLPGAWFLLTGGVIAAVATNAVADRLRSAGFRNN